MQHEHTPTSGELMVGAALGCSTAWVSMAFKSMGLYAGMAQAESTLDAVYLVSIISVALTLLVAGALAQETEKLITGKASIWALPAAIAASTLAMPLCTRLPAGADITAMVAVGAISGVASGLFLIRFGVSFSLLSTGSCITAAATGTIAASLLFALFLLFDPLPACSLAASMPLFAAVLLAFGMHVLADQGKAESIESAAEQARKERGEEGPERMPKRESALSGRELDRLTLQLALCSALIGFSNEAVRTLYVHMGVRDVGGAGYAAVEGGGAFVATVIVVGIALALANMKTQRMARNIYHFLILLLVNSVLLLLVPVVYGQRAALIAHALNSASYACFGMFMWTILAGVCNRCPGQRIRTFAFVRAGWALGPLAGVVAGRFVLHQLGISVESAMPIIGFGVLAILIASGFAFSETDLARAMDLLPIHHKRRFREKCARIAAEHALSDRESQVMVLLAKGRNLPYIQDELLLSKSTVSTHRQHIYAKLDIHSQQELIDLVQNTKEKPTAS